VGPARAECTRFFARAHLLDGGVDILVYCWRQGFMRSPALVLMHKRRVSEAQATGGAAAFVCHDCRGAFGARNPRMCKFAVANHMWLGRQDPLFRGANLSHQMLLALARVVTTKVILRPEGRSKARSGDGPTWDFLFHQSGMVGSAILFGNATCTEATQHFHPSLCRALLRKPLSPRRRRMRRTV